MKKIKLLISGIHCASCASNIEKSVKKVSGVKTISVNAITSKAILETEDNISVDEIKKAVQKVGYKVVSIE